MQLPSEFCRQIKTHLKESEYYPFIKALSETEPVSIRVNESKWNKEIKLEKVKWCPLGYYLEQRIPFTFDPLFHAGAYYVQEASSMFLYQAIRQTILQPVKALDLCAAPGGKSTLLLSALPENSLLVANEIIRNRAQILKENIIKWGAHNVIVTNNTSEDFMKLPGYFDVILADVPCSGEGMFRKDPAAIGEWTMENVDKCVTRQKQIIQNVWKTLLPGGLLIYSTCTYNTKENEENIEWICKELGAEPLSLKIDDSWNIKGSLIGETYPCYRFFPHQVKGEGFFMSVIRKNGKTQDFYKESLTPKTDTKKNKITDYPVKWIKNDENFVFENTAENIMAYTREWETEIRKLKKTLHVLLGGVHVASRKGKEWMPTHQLAMSSHLNGNEFPTHNLTHEEAIRFLRKEPVELPDNLPTGYLLLMFDTIPVGWVKNIGKRCNNLYPQEYRIKTTYTPETLKSLLL